MKAKGRTSAQRILWTALYTPGPNGRMGLPVCIVGPPGTGKTSEVRQVVHAAGLHFECVICSLREPADFLGLPIPQRVKLVAANQWLSPDGDAEAMLVKYAPANFAVRATLARRTVVFLDEVNTAPPAVQAALLRLVNEGVCGELELPSSVRFLMAMNRVDQAVGGWDIAPPLANRVLWLDWPEPDPLRFVEYLMGNGADAAERANPKEMENAVVAAWPNAWAKAAGTMAGFITAKPDALMRMPAVGSAQASAAWPSPRTNDLATMAMAGADIWGLTDSEELTLVSAAIGHAAAGELHTWRKNNDLPNPEALLDGQVTFTHSAARLDRTAAVLASCTALIVRKDCANRAARAEKLWEIHGTLADTASDVALGSVVAMCNERLMLGSKTAYKVLGRMEPFMVAAGVTAAER